MHKFILILAALVVAFVFSSNPVSATAIWFDPVDQQYDVGDTIAIDLYADIDQADAVFGFSFDLSFDGGATYISGPGESGSYLTFTGFTVNSVLFDDPFVPLWDDGDGIAGSIDIFSPDVWGTNLLLGTFYFDATGTDPIGVEEIYLGPAAGDYGLLGEEGLLGATALMSNNPTASVSPVPEPSMMLLVCTGLMGLAGVRRKCGK